MKTVIVTDGKYRAAIAAARSLGRAGYRVIVTQTRGDCKNDPPVFFSRFAEGVWLDGSVTDDNYVNQLEALCGRYDRPAILCVGAGTLNRLAAAPLENAEALIAPPEVLDALNDKARVQARAMELGLPVPETFSGPPERFPVIVKPRCGEKAGLKAAERYRIAGNAEEFQAIYAHFQKYDPAPLVQEVVTGPGRGVSVLMDRDGRLLRAVCHRRVREYPYRGGPSTCCVTEWDAARVETARKLLASFGFFGLAMVEFKGEAILEVNPRIWGSFPLGVFAGSSICPAYVQAAAGEPVEPALPDYRVGVKARFLVNDLAAGADLLRHGKPAPALAALRDLFAVPEVLKDKEDKKAYRRYIRSYL